MTTIGAGAVTYIVGPVTGAAIGASSDVIALSIASVFIEAIIVMIGTPLRGQLQGSQDAALGDDFPAASPERSAAERGTRGDRTGGSCPTVR